ncbi:hypothetical protein Nos7524_2947 [Nostoc sp. PCC 7524]|nr:hypothetical protein Nos7524_2947 [Nostoc sp. PCC 7524]
MGKVGENGEDEVDTAEKISTVYPPFPTPYSLFPILSPRIYTSRELRKYKCLIISIFRVLFHKLRIFLYGQLYLQSGEIVIEQ